MDSNGTPTIVPSITDLQPSAAPASLGCGVPPWSQAVYEASGAKDFIKEQFGVWKQSHDPNNDFTKWYFDTWLPGVGPEAARCGSGFMCSVSGLISLLLLK